MTEKHVANENHYTPPLAPVIGQSQPGSIRMRNLRRIAFYGNFVAIISVLSFPFGPSIYLFAASLGITAIASIWVITSLISSSEWWAATRPALTLLFCLLIASIFIPAILGNIRAARRRFNMDHQKGAISRESPNHSMHQTLPLRGIAGDFES